MSDGANYSNGVWSYTKGQVKLAVDPSHQLVTLSLGANTLSANFGDGSKTANFTLPGTSTSISLSSNGEGAISIGSGVFTGVLRVRGIGGSFGIQGLELSASKSGSFAGIKGSAECSALLAPAYSSAGAFDGFTGKASCTLKETIPLFGEKSQELFKKSGSMNSDDFLSNIPGVSALQNGIQKGKNVIDEQASVNGTIDGDALGLAIAWGGIGTDADYAGAISRFSLGGSSDISYLASTAAAYVAGDNAGLKSYLYGRFNANLQGYTGNASLVLENGSAGIVGNNLHISGDGSGLVIKANSGSGSVSDVWSTYSGYSGSTLISGSDATYRTYLNGSLIDRTHEDSSGSSELDYGWSGSASTLSGKLYSSTGLPVAAASASYTTNQLLSSGGYHRDLFSQPTAEQINEQNISQAFANIGVTFASTGAIIYSPKKVWYSEPAPLDPVIDEGGDTWQSALSEGAQAMRWTDLVQKTHANDSSTLERAVGSMVDAMSVFGHASTGSDTNVCSIHAFREFPTLARPH